MATITIGPGITLGPGITFGPISSASITDPYFQYVTLLLSGDGTNAARNNTFTDSSTNNFSITRAGNTTQGTFSPYGDNWSNYFGGSGNYASNTSVALIAQSVSTFTVEGWIFMTAAPGSDANNISGLVTLDGQAGGNINYMSFGPISSRVLYLRWYDGTGKTAIGSTTLNLNQWYHIACVVNSNSVQFYVNGVAETMSGTTTLTTRSGTSSNFAISANNYGNFTGYISNLRTTNTAVYTSTFTPPTTPLTAIAGTSLLTCQSNRFVDNSTNNFTITRSGTPSVQRWSPFNPTAAYSTSTIGGSGYFDGVGDSLASTTNFEASTSTSTFTIEGFVYPTTFSTLINIIGGIAVSSGDAKSIAAEVNTSGRVALYWFDGAIKRCTGNTVMQLNAWNYFAIVVNSNAISIYVNKTTADTLTGTATLTNRTQQIGLGVGAYFNSGSPQYFNGYLANLRYSTVARTISSVPTAPLSSDSDTRWLLNFTNAGIWDSAMINNLETVGNAQISTSVFKYGTGSMAFDGTGDYLFAPSLPDFVTGDFTIEFWIYRNSTARGGLLRSGGSTTNGSIGQWFLLLENSNTQLVWQSRVGVTNAWGVSSSSLTTLTWHHVAVVRQSGVFKVFFNGSSQSVASGSFTDSTSYSCAQSSVGGNFSGYEFNGYIDDLRVTRGYARYTSNFTPPGALS